jgi:hypothetical protein
VHIYCKKGIHQILSDMVSEQILEWYKKSLSYQIAFIKPPNAAKVQVIFIPKHAQHIKRDEAVVNAGFHVNCTVMAEMDVQ